MSRFRFLFTAALSALLAALALLASPLRPVMGAVRSGAAYTDSGNQDNRPLYWRNVLEILDKDLRPFTNLLMKLDTVQVTDPKFNLFEDDDVPLWTQINGGNLLSSDTSLTVDDGTVFATNSRAIFPRTGEVVLITAISTNTLTVTRAYNGTTAAALLDNDWLLNFGELIYEGDDTPAIKTYVPTTVYNYTEIFREAYGYTGTNAVTKKRADNDPERDQKMALRNIKKRMEFSLRFGVKSLSGSGSTLERHTGGFTSYISTNDFKANGALSEPFLMECLEQVFRYATGPKLVFCGRRARKEIDGLGLQARTIAATDTSNKLGVKITSIENSFGEVGLITDHTLQNGWAGECHIVDPQHARLAVLRELRLLKNRQGNGEDLVKDEFLTEQGLMLDTEKAHGRIRGVGSALLG